MDVKILRFLELSSEFCKEPEDYKGLQEHLTQEQYFQQLVMQTLSHI